MSRNEKAIHAKLDQKYLYQTYTTNKLATYFGIAKKVLHEATDYSTAVQTFELLRDQFDFYEHVCTLHADRSNLNLEMFLDPSKFARSYMLEQFLLGESTLNPNQAGNYVMFIHVGALILALYRGEDFELGGNLIVNTPQEGSFVLCRIQDYLQSRYPKPVE